MLGNVCVTGGSSGISSRSDYATVKYSQSTGIVNLSNEIPAKFFLSQNYPNLFNPSTQFDFQIPVYSYVRIVIDDAMGMEIETVVNEQLQPGLHTGSWNASGYAGGIYFYRINSGTFKETKRMVLIK